MTGVVDAGGQAPLGFSCRRARAARGFAPCLRLLLRLVETARVLHGRMKLQGFVARSRAGEVDLGLVASRPGAFFLLSRRFEMRLRFAPCPAGIVEVRLRLAEDTRLPAALRSRIDPIALLEPVDGLRQGLELLELATILFQLTERLGDVGEQFRGKRRQGLGQRIRESGLIGFARQLWLAKLDQRVHQRVVAPGAEMQQPLVHGAAVVLGRVEDLAAALEKIAQPFLGQHHTLRAGQPDVAVDARGTLAVLDDEEPAVYLRSAGRRRKAGAEGEVVRGAIGGAAAKLDPGIAHAPGIAVHQQVPGHPLAAVAVRLDARRFELGVEQEGQGKRQHLRFPRPVVAAQQQMAVAKPELLAVVVKQLDQAQAKRLPAFPRRCRQGWLRRPPVEQSRAVVHASSMRVSRISASPSANRDSAGRGRTKPERRSTS